MSISTQPSARQSNLQRALSNRLSASTLPDTLNVKDASILFQKKPELFAQQPAYNIQCMAAAKAVTDGSTAVLQPQALPHQSQSHCSQKRSLTLPALNNAPAPCEAKQHTGRNPSNRVADCMQTSSSSPAGDFPNRVPAFKQTSTLLPARQARKRACPEQSKDVRLDLRADQLQAEFAAMKAGTISIADTAAWAATARQTACEVSHTSVQGLVNSQEGCV